jgi:hypothetical protein
VSRQITVEGIARAVRYLERAFWRYDQEAIAEALKEAGIDRDTAGFVGTFLNDIWDAKLLPEKPEPKCAVCGKITARGPLDTPDPRANAVYCSNKCRQKAYRKRKAARYGKKPRRDRPTVTKGESGESGESVTEAPPETAVQS